MKPTNEIVLKMVLASSVGQAMSDADRDALRQTLETTDVRDVQGWLGDQIRKAGAIFKGDFVGHPFRGNQHSDSSGSSTGGASGGAKGGAQGAKNLGLKVGDYSVISRDGMDYEGKVVGIKNGVVTFETANNANGEDYDDPREIDIKLSEITDIDGEKVEDTSPAAGRKRIAAVDAKLSEAKRMRETSAQQERARLGLPKEETAGKPPMSSAGKRTVTAANRSLKSFREVVDELDALQSSRDQIIDDLVDQEGVSRKNATQDVDDDIAVLRYAVNNSKFKDDAGETEGEKKVRERSEQAANAERGRQRQERAQAASTARRGKLIPLNADNADDSLKGDEAKEFKSQHKNALDSVKQTRALIAELRVKAQGLKGQRRDDADAALQDAQEETDGFESIVRENSKATFRSAVSISAMGTNRGEQAKGSIRMAMEALGAGDDRRDSAMQDAGDKYFGVNGDKYDVEAIYDLIGN